MGNDFDIFTNKKFITDVNNLHEREQIIGIYKQNFEKIKDFIDNLFTSLITNINSIPYALRSICKIIYELIIRKVRIIYII